MLILERHLDESVVIDTGREVIKVTLVATKGGKVRLGFDAARHVRIDREEIRERKLRGEPPYRPDRDDGGPAR